RFGALEQAGCSGAGHQRDHGQGAPPPGHGEDEGRLAGGARAARREARNPDGPALAQLYPSIVVAPSRAGYVHSDMSDAIAIVDDDESLRLALASLFRSAGFHVLVF